MAEIEEVSLAIGRLQSSVEAIAANQITHQERDDTQHRVTQSLVADKNRETQLLLTTLSNRVDKDFKRLEERVDVLERTDHVTKKALKWAGAVIGLIVLFLSGTWEHWFGK